MKTIYWICFGYLLMQSVNWLLHNAIIDEEEVDVCALYLQFLRVIVGISFWIGTIYFYLH